LVNALKRSGGDLSLDLINHYFNGWDLFHKEDSSLLEKKISEQLRVWMEDGVLIKKNNG
jgi:hypothetical protein